MRWTYDAQAAALYVTLHDGHPRRQEVTDEGLILDLDDSGTVLGIELIAPWGNDAIGDLLPRLGLSDDTARFLRDLVTQPMFQVRSAVRLAAVTSPPVTASSVAPARVLLPA